MGFQKSLRYCVLDESSLSTGKVKISRGIFTKLAQSPGISFVPFGYNQYLSPIKAARNCLVNFSLELELEFCFSSHFMPNVANS